ncbi:MAG TPA: aldo/keto reductase [Candidatus Saccharimonadales bacterium]|nr:aldo/keto reductase [Candidatus Saccharimonadales bacterium]
MKIPAIKLNDNNSIPQIALGLWQIRDPSDFAKSFDAAFEAGYRHFDSAQIYGNEKFLGNAVKKAGLKRNDIFITTKIGVNNFGFDRAKTSFAESLNKLQMDYVDLLLLHFPVPLLRKKSWLALEEIQAAGQAKSIGVSNYTIRHLEEMSDYAKLKPSINQVELHVFLQQPELVKYCQENSIVIEAYSPLAHAKAMDNTIIQSIATKHGKSYAQIMLRWCIEQDTVPLPKSSNPDRIRENIDIFDFQLDKDDLAEISKLDENMRTTWSPVHVP